MCWTKMTYQSPNAKVCDQLYCILVGVGQDPAGTVRGGVAAAGHVAPSGMASRVHINSELGFVSMVLCRMAFAV